MAEKVTTMVLKVDHDCPPYYKKIKKIFRAFPDIRNQVYDDDRKEVTITVLCSNPEEFRDELHCRGRKVIKCIEIKEPPKPAPKVTKEPPKPAPKVAQEEPPKPKMPKEPQETKNPPTTETIPLGYPAFYPRGPCYGGYGRGPCYHVNLTLVLQLPRPCCDGYCRCRCRCRCDGSLYDSDGSSSACSLLFP